VLGFDFGYSVAYPKSLVIWEAQFGDFANGAQVIIDQFIASSEQKWNLCSNLTLLLPHGYEGQGPEHSSGRMERFLQLAGNNNCRIANCTTPAQLFHLLRAQALNETKKPLIVFTPKALLRHPQCVSTANDFTQGGFQEVLADPSSPSAASSLILCSGKVFYDLFNERQKQQASTVMIVRIEQLYPFPEEALQRILPKTASHIVWAQEEHENMGAWEFIHPHLTRCFPQSEIRYAGRERSASPAAGSYALHKAQYERFITQVFKGRT
jgi:2-oxoglutarate dehydrogenase E1 component